MSVLESLRFGLGRTARVAADRLATTPLLAWTWSGGSETRFVSRLLDFRPLDGQTVVEMMEGKYLLAGEIVDTGGVSPFAVETASAAWEAELHSFGWLRHFRALRDTGQRRFARTLVIDWIGRYGRFEEEAWGGFVTARRVLNWLKNYDLLIEEAGPDAVRSISRALSIQIHSLKARLPLAADLLEKLMMAIALVGAALSSEEAPSDLEALANQLESLLALQIDADGLHLSRNPRVQLQILSELIPVSEVLVLRRSDLIGDIRHKLDAMHRAFEKLILGTREPVFANGCGQVAVELVLAIAAQSGGKGEAGGLCGGYGTLCDGMGRVVADSGLVPPLDFASDAHAGALSFEFSCGSTLVVGNCGPAPAQLADSQMLFRHSSAHSSITIDDSSSAHLGGPGWLADRIRPMGEQPSIAYLDDENAIEMRTPAYRGRYGLDIVRRLTLMGGGHTLVGQDRMLAAPGRGPAQQGDFSIRFHLAVGVVLERSPGEDLIRMIHRNGEVWTFLWEGAHAEIEDSVRHSAHFGLNRTRQIVLSGRAAPEREIAWVFTRQ